MLNKTYKFLLLLNIFFFLTINSFSIEPSIFVQSTVNRASQALGDSISKEKKIKLLKEIAKETVDINGIGLYTLGKHRKSLSNNQKKNIEYFLKSIF